MFNFSRLFALALIFSLAACSGGNSNSRLDYKEAKSLGGLEVPPDLVAPVNTGDTDMPGHESVTVSQEVLPQLKGVRIARDGLNRWLVVDTPVETLWPRLRSFWATLGLEVQMDKPAMGIMETSWAENRADAPRGFITEWVRKLFKNAYSSDTRDKYRLRLERGEGGSSEIYITHYGLKEVVVNAQSEIVQTTWEVRPSDPELTNEVLNHLVIYLGGTEKVAAQLQAQQAEPERARVEGDTLVMSEGFARSWRRVGIVLDRLGVVVEDRNRSQGVYYVSQIELLPEEQGKGWFSSLFASNKKEAKSDEPQTRIVLRGDDSLTRLNIFNMDGTPRRDGMADGLLKRLHAELK